VLRLVDAEGDHHVMDAAEGPVLPTAQMLSDAGDRKGGRLWTAAGGRFTLNARLMKQPVTAMCRLR